MDRSAARARAASAAADAGLATAMARRSAAFDAGEDAFWDGTISADAYMLYRLLVRLCREQCSCWPGLQWLAERTRVSVGTIKRRLDELERAALIVRQQRPGGLTARTVVRALARAMPGVTTNSAETSLAAQEAADDPVAPASAAAEGAFFCATRSAIDDPADGSAVIHATMKNRSTNGGRAVESHAARLLREAGVLSPRVRSELAGRSIEEIQRCLAVARAQPNVVDAAGLAVALLRANEAQRAEHGAPGRVSATSRTTATRTVARPKPHAPPERAERGSTAGTFDPTGARTAPSTDAALWAAVQQALRATLDEQALTTWFAGASVALLGAGEAVLVVDNVFTRTWIREHALGALKAAFRDVLGGDVTVSIELG